MNEKSPSKTWKTLSSFLNILIVFIFLGLLGYLGFQYYLLTKYQPTVVKEILAISESKELDQIESTAQFANPANESEISGRPDPMAPF